MFRLNPYEVVQVVITTGTGVDLFGDDQNVTDDILDGSAHADALQGYDGDDWLRGFDGNDVIDGGAGDDLINAGNGDDVITTGAGSDTALGGAGDDTLDYSASETAVRIYARDGIAELDGAGSTDTFSGIENFIGSEHADTIFTDSITASVDSSAGDDFIRLLGGDGTTIEAGLGDDFVLAEFGSATVDLGAGSDRLLAFAARVDVDGGDGEDILHGGAENDTLDGGQGNDTLSGGGGADTFVFRSGGGSDVILDFDTGEDLIDLTDLGISFDDLSVVANGSGTDLQFAGDTIFELQSVSAGDVTADLFIF